MLRALFDEVEERRWGHVEELLATNVEILHALYRWMLAVYGEKRMPIPDQLRWPRPSDRRDESDDDEPERRVTRHTYRRALLGGGKPDGL